MDAKWITDEIRKIHKGSEKNWFDFRVKFRRFADHIMYDGYYHGYIVCADGEYYISLTDRVTVSEFPRVNRRVSIEQYQNKQLLVDYITSFYLTDF